MTIEPKILEELKTKLLQEKKDLEIDLGKIAKPVNKEKGDYETSFNELGTDTDENATEVSEYVENLAVENTLEKRLQEVNEALNRIDQGAYGFCANCGDGKQDIDIERLKANPAAKTCIKCG